MRPVVVTEFFRELFDGPRGVGRFDFRFVPVEVEEDDAVEDVWNSKVTFSSSFVLVVVVDNNLSGHSVVSLLGCCCWGLESVLSLEESLLFRNEDRRCVRVVTLVRVVVALLGDVVVVIVGVTWSGGGIASSSSEVMTGGGVVVSSLGFDGVSAEL